MKRTISPPSSPVRCGGPGPLWSALLVVAVAVVAGLGGITAFFVGDDFDFLVQVERMRGLADAVRLSFWGEWEPLWYLGFYRDWKLWGLAPAGYHLAGLLALALAAVALQRIVTEVWPESTIAPWAAALLFATHPLQDEAVTYVAARGHPLSVALSLVALWCYVRLRRAGAARLLWGAAALGSALAAALAKETALVLPAWVAALEWGVLGGLRPARLGRALRAGLLFALPAAAYFVLRAAVVGLDSDKLRGPADGLGGMVESFLEQVPQYALAGGLPLPFAFLDGPAVGALRPLGGLLAVAAALVAVLAVARGLRARRAISTPVGLYLFALTVIAVGLLPVLWADLGLRRRYFHAPSVGVALAAAVVLEWLAVRRARAAAWVLLALLAAGGAAGLWQRNALYRQAGAVTRDLFEQARASGAGAAARQRRVGVITLPRYLGGDGFSGAYVLHHTDARSALRLAGLDADFSSALAADFADDYAAEAAFRGPDRLEVTVSFRTRRAYDAARGRKPEPVGRLLRAVMVGADDAAHVLRYDVRLAPGFPYGPRDDLYLYGGGRFRRLSPPRSP